METTVADTLEMRPVPTRVLARAMIVCSLFFLSVCDSSLAWITWSPNLSESLG
jgi:hypothetical protein